jgi:rod shape-determining protein MreD
MNVYTTLLLLALVALLQATVAPLAGLGAAQPELALLVVVIWALVRGPRQALVWALVLGLMLDQLSARPIGMYSLPLMAVALLAGTGRSVAFGTHLVLPVVMTVLATLLYGLLQLAMLGLVRGGTVLWGGSDLVGVLLPIVALNLLWLPVLYFPLRALARRDVGPRMDWGRL